MTSQVSISPSACWWLNFSFSRHALTVDQDCPFCGYFELPAVPAKLAHGGLSQFNVCAFGLLIWKAVRFSPLLLWFLLWGFGAVLAFLFSDSLGSPTCTGFEERL